MSDGTILFEILDDETGEYWSVDDNGDAMTMHYVADYTAPMASIPLPPRVLARLLAPTSTPIADRRQRVIPFRRVA